MRCNPPTASGSWVKTSCAATPATRTATGYATSATAACSTMAASTSSELNKFAAEHVETEEQRWLKFFKDGEHLNADHLPDWMQTPEMRQAMTTLKAFSDKERAYHVYQARQDFLRQQRSIQRELDDERSARAAERAAREVERQAKEAALQVGAAERQAKEAALQAQEAERQAKEAALQAQEAERQAKEAALAEIERLKALLHDRDRPADA